MKVCLSTMILTRRSTPLLLLGAMLSLIASAWLLVPEQVCADPLSSWTGLSGVVVQEDCFGAGDQGDPDCDDYDADLYERLNYGSGKAATADIKSLRSYQNTGYFYVEFDFVDSWSEANSTGHQVVIEIDTDVDGDGDYYVGLQQKKEFNSTGWKDAKDNGGYEVYWDKNDNVGGSNPGAPDNNPGDGYEEDPPDEVKDGNDVVWARIVGGNFQVAVKRSAFGSPPVANLRSWSAQESSIDKGKMSLHDHEDDSGIQKVDNSAGADSDEWIPTLAIISSLEAYEESGTVLVVWETASEIENAGFHLWRSETVDGQYDRITDFLIPAEGGPSWGADYSYEGADVFFGDTFYYWLEDIDLSGVSTYHGPVSATVSYARIIPYYPEDEAGVPAYLPSTFKWESEILGRYRLQFSRSPVFASKVVTLPKSWKDQWISGTTYAPKRNEWWEIRRLGSKGEAVYWRVYGEDDQGNGLTSAASSFTIQRYSR